MKRVMLIGLIVIMLYGCSKTAPPLVSNEKQIEITHLGNVELYYSADIGRFEDKDAGVVCWVIAEYSGGGISCLPLDQTNLSKE
jgi:hypothetical protein